MNLLFMIPRYYPRVGSIKHVVKSVAERLIKKEHDVTVLCGESNIVNSKEECINEVRVLWGSWLGIKGVPYSKNEESAFQLTFERYKGM